MIQTLILKAFSFDVKQSVYALSIGFRGITIYASERKSHRKTQDKHRCSQISYLNLLFWVSSTNTNVEYSHVEALN